MSCQLAENSAQKRGYSIADWLGITQHRQVHAFINESASRIHQLVVGQIDVEIAWIDLHERICRFAEKHVEWIQKVDDVPLGTCWRETLSRVAGDPFDQMVTHVRAYSRILNAISQTPAEGAVMAIAEPMGI